MRRALVGTLRVAGLLTLAALMLAAAGVAMLIQPGSADGQAALRDQRNGGPH